MTLHAQPGCGSTRTGTDPAGVIQPCKPPGPGPSTSTADATPRRSNSANAVALLRSKKILRGSASAIIAARVREGYDVASGATAAPARRLPMKTATYSKVAAAHIATTS